MRRNRWRVVDISFADLFGVLVDDDGFVAWGFPYAYLPSANLLVTFAQNQLDNHLLLSIRTQVSNNPHAPHSSVISNCAHRHVTLPPTSSLPMTPFLAFSLLSYITIPRVFPTLFPQHPTLEFPTLPEHDQFMRAFQADVIFVVNALEQLDEDANAGQQQTELL